eukprot:Awhi_evm2s13016
MYITERFVFGSFVSDKYQGGGWKTGNNENFLFSFGKESEKIPVVKLLKVSGAHGFRDVYNCGLHVGSGSDLVVRGNNCQANYSSYTTEASGFSALPSHYETIAGKKGAFQIQEMETYQVVFGE